MKRSGAMGLEGGWVKTRGVKIIQFMCRKTGMRSMRKEVPCKLISEKIRRQGRSRRTWNDDPLACLEITPKAMGSRGPANETVTRSWPVRIISKLVGLVKDGNRLLGHIGDVSVRETRGWKRLFIYEG